MKSNCIVQLVGRLAAEEGVLLIEGQVDLAEQHGVARATREVLAQ